MLKFFFIITAIIGLALCVVRYLRLIGIIVLLISIVLLIIISSFEKRTKKEITPNSNFVDLTSENSNNTKGE